MNASASERLQKKTMARIQIDYAHSSMCQMTKAMAPSHHKRAMHA
jgi:hypothetical protein